MPSCIQDARTRKVNVKTLPPVHLAEKFLNPSWSPFSSLIHHPSSVTELGHNCHLILAAGAQHADVVFSYPEIILKISTYKNYMYENFLGSPGNQYLNHQQLRVVIQSSTAVHIVSLDTYKQVDMYESQIIYSYAICEVLSPKGKQYYQVPTYGAHDYVNYYKFSFNIKNREQTIF